MPSGKVTTILPPGKRKVLAVKRKARRASSSASVGACPGEVRTGVTRSAPGEGASPECMGPTVAMTMQLTRCSTTVSWVSCKLATEPSETSPSAASVRSTCAAVGRRSGFLASMRAIRSPTTRGTSGTTSERWGGSSSMSLARSTPGSWPRKVGLPVRHSCATQPSEKTSARPSIVPPPSMVSGAR